MQRRTFLATAAAAVAVAPAFPAVAAINPQITHAGRVLWAPGTQASGYHAAVMEGLGFICAKESLPFRGDFSMPQIVHWQNPRVEVSFGKVWHAYNGYKGDQTEPGLKVDYYDGDIYLGYSRTVLRPAGYFSSEPHSEEKRYIDIPWIEYERQKEIQALRGFVEDRDRIRDTYFDYDMSWLKA